MILGIDLHIKRPSVFCFFKNFKAIFFESLNEEDVIGRLKPKIVVIDAPLSNKKPFRDFEYFLMKKGYRFMPLSMKSIEELTKKAVELKNKFPKIKFFETHPGSLSRWMKIDIKDKDYRDAFLCAFVGYLYLKGFAREIDGFLYI